MLQHLFHARKQRHFLATNHVERLLTAVTTAALCRVMILQQMHVHSVHYRVKSSGHASTPAQTIPSVPVTLVIVATALYTCCCPVIAVKQALNFHVIEQLLRERLVRKSCVAPNNVQSHSTIVFIYVEKTATKGLVLVLLLAVVKLKQQCGVAVNG
jgi:hypothetical protein